jgi:hypothetical protein
MQPALYCARIGESRSLAEEVPYEELLQRITEFIIRAVLARSIDQSDWEHEELRRRGLATLQVFRNKKAVWTDRETFELERAEAQRKRDPRFERANELDAKLYDRLDRDLRAHWRRAGYKTPSLVHDMKTLFCELERDAAERAAAAREGLLAELL